MSFSRETSLSGAVIHWTGLEHGHFSSLFLCLQQPRLEPRPSASLLQLYGYTVNRPPPGCVNLSCAVCFPILVAHEQSTGVNIFSSSSFQSPPFFSSLLIVFFRSSREALVKSRHPHSGSRSRTRTQPRGMRSSARPRGQRGAAITNCANICERWLRNAARQQGWNGLAAPVPVCTKCARRFYCRSRGC